MFWTHYNYLKLWLHVLRTLVHACVLSWKYAHQKNDEDGGAHAPALPPWIRPWILLIKLHLSLPVMICKMRAKGCSSGLLTSSPFMCFLLLFILLLDDDLASSFTVLSTDEEVNTWCRDSTWVSILLYIFEWYYECIRYKHTHTLVADRLHTFANGWPGVDTPFFRSSVWHHQAWQLINGASGFEGTQNFIQS